MAYEVFISYSSKDKCVADAIVSHAEGQDIQCWVAPRDILPSQHWAEAIVAAIEMSQIMVVIVSDHANQSVQVMNEVERAVNHQKIIVPFKISDIPLSKGLEYFLSSRHWLDALTPPMKQHICELVDTLHTILNGCETQDAKKTQKDPPSDLKSISVDFEEMPPDEWESPRRKNSVLGFLKSIFDDQE